MKMNVKVECELFGALNSRYKKNKFLLTVLKGTTYQELLLKYLKFSPKYLKYFSIVVDSNKVVALTQKITKDQKVYIFLPLSGG
jgi:molybdopterin converting factor small subunit